MRAMDLERTSFPERIGDYQLLRRIGRGGMGEVYLATRPGLAKPCALKVLLPEHSRNPEYRRRFLREAKILSTLRHGRIVTVLEVGEADGYLYIAMDYIDGVNLRTLCEVLAAQGRRLPVMVVGFIIGEMFEALRHAHTRTIGGVLHGVIHRDVTPDNVMISSEGEVFLSDFGIARFGADGSAEMFGKLQYMAPEQGLGQATYRSDVWSACGVLHYMLTGEPPRLALTWSEFRANMHPTVRPTGRGDVPEPLERLRVGGLEPDASKRLASARDALLLLESWLGYRKATTMLAEIYGHVIGPARSGMTDMVPAAPPVVVPSSASEPILSDGRRANESAIVVVGRVPSERATVGDADDSDDDRPGTWRKRWWKVTDERGGEQELEEQRTTQFVEADAPRVFRRKRVVPVSEAVPEEAPSRKLAATEELQSVVQAAGGSAPEITPPLDASVLASSAGGSTERYAAAPEPTSTPEPKGASTSNPPPLGPPADAMASSPLRKRGAAVRSRTKIGPGQILLLVGFAVVMLGLLAGLVATCDGTAGLGRASGHTAEGP